MTRFRRLLALLLWGRTTPEPPPVTEPATNVTVLTGRHTDQPYDWEGDADA